MIDDIITIFIAQILFQGLRTAGTFTIAKNNMKLTLIFSVLIQILWLWTTYIGINSIMNNNYAVVISYILGGTLGTYIAMTWHPDKINKTE